MTFEHQSIKLLKRDFNEFSSMYHLPIQKVSNEMKSDLSTIIDCFVKSMFMFVYLVNLKNPHHN